MKNTLSYRDAGVDIDAGSALVKMIKPLAAATRRPGADGSLGGFGGFFDPKAAGYKDPLLVAATDGVGTKLKLAIETGLHEGVGIDLVAMCVNDLIVQGAAPLAFLDYFSCGKLDNNIAHKVISGIAAGCKQADCALIGGETAEMPGMYATGHYDLAGFAIGAVERHEVIDGSRVAVGDQLLALASSGIHANGFSLVRKILEQEKISLDRPTPWQQDTSLGNALMIPTRIYVKSCLIAIRSGGVHALCHITGGGFYENLPRIMGPDMACRIKRGAWPYLPVFQWLAQQGGVSDSEMLRTFNCGVGMVLIVARQALNSVLKALEGAGENVYSIGEIIQKNGGPSVCFLDES